MIEFIGNQFRGMSVEGLYRARNFRVADTGYQTPGGIIALPEIGVLRVVTFSPHTFDELDTYPNGRDIEEIVNKASKAATHIASVLRLKDDNFGFLFT